MRALHKVLGVVLLATCWQAAWADTTIESFSPQGTVKGVRQVQARFTEQIVPFGDLRLDDPFTVTCPEHGTGRWVDGKNWSYDFDRDLPAGVNCSFTLKSGLKDLAGKPVSAPQPYSFSTGGPAIIESSPSEGSWYVDENQIFILGLDTVAKTDSIERNAYCAAEGINEKIGVRLITGKTRDELLAVRKKFIDRYLTVYFKARGGVWQTTLAFTNERLDKLPIVMVQCKQTFPADTKVSLVWGAGITSESGIATTADQKLAFKTRADFSANFSCQRTNADGNCIPFLPMWLNFSTPIKASDAKAITLTSTGGKVYRPQLEGDAEKSGFTSSVYFQDDFPENAVFKLALPAYLKDDAGRTLMNASSFPLTVRTDEQPPLVKFPSRFGIIEAAGDKMLPVTVRNVEANLPANITVSKTAMTALKGEVMRVVGWLSKSAAPSSKDDLLGAEQDEDMAIIAWMKRLNGDKYESWSIGSTYNEELKKSIFGSLESTASMTIPKPNGKKAFEVIGIPLKKNGFYVVELQSPKLGAAILNGGTAYVQTAALVTNLAAHFKHGAESSLVWVTTLDKGLPMPGARVAVRGCDGKLLWQGVTDKSGVASITQKLPTVTCKSNGNYFISARSGEDMTFTLSDWTGGIETWRFNVATAGFDAENVMANTVFDRTLLRAGETVHMKHFLRQHTMTGIRLANAGGAGANQKLMVTHEGTDEQYEFPLKWTAAGTAESVWKIPEDAKLGSYRLTIGQYTTGSFRVEEFRVPTMKAILEGPKTPLIQVKNFDLDLQLNYLSGGGASNAQVKLRTVIKDKYVSFADYGDFRFSNGNVKEGVDTGSGPNDDEEVGDEGQEQDDSAEPSGKTKSAIKTRTLTLDAAGAARVSIDKLTPAQKPQNVLAELEFQDANGETSSVSTDIPLWSSKYVIGIKPDSWAVSKDAFKFQTVVLTVDGKPALNAPVAVDFFVRNTYSHRRRLIGGFYAYENTTEIKRIGPACEGKTDNKGMLYCTVKAPATGNVILRAKTTDEDGHAAYANTDTWVAGEENWWFTASDNDRIDVLPEKKRYEPGQQATFQVRMPFREATALVTVEREGIIDTYVWALSGKKPVFSIPVKGNYAPNVFVSVLVVRGRVDSIQPTALVDLGKPAYKMGITNLQVGWQAHELKVQVTTDKPTYRVREKAKTHIKVVRADGRPLPAGAEIALAAVDVGLLELMPNDSWALLETMMQERSLQVETSTAQMQVVGKRHFGRKAVPAGGGGGASSGRELFDTLLFWKSRVVLNAKGEADVEVPLNDSLTAFRIVAIANANADLFGTGKTDIRSTQDLILMSGLPSLVREDDNYRAGFTLRNTSNAAMTVDLDAMVGDGKRSASIKMPTQTVTIEPGQAQEVGWDHRVPLGVQAQVWDVSAKARDGSMTDKIRIKQKVTFAIPVRTYQATLMQMEKSIEMGIQMPADALPGRGGILTLLKPRLGSDLPGVKEYMSRYPYSCYEQIASKAVALQDEKMWVAHMNALPAYLDSNGLIKYFTQMDYGSEVLTSYILSIADEAGYEIPVESKSRMEEALIGFVQGRIFRYSRLATADVAIRKVAALEALSRSKKVDASMLQSFSIEPNLWPTSAVIDWYLVLLRTEALPSRSERLAQAEQILRSRLNFQGTTMGFSTERMDDLWWLMISTDVNANRILLAMLENQRWNEDIGRLVRGTLGRQHQGRWNTTVANAWGVLAMKKFSDKFESVPVSGTTKVTLNAQPKTLDWAKRADGGALFQPWPKDRDQLTIDHTGTGKPWVTIQSLAAIPLKTPLSSGYKVVKTITPIEQKKPGTWSRGDVYRVHLDLEAQSDMTWVVVDDPIPASASILGTGLGRDSKIMSTGEKREGWVWPAYEERTFEAFRAYYEFVPKGKWTVEYTVRLNNQGDFVLPQTRIEAMYSPEMFGEVPNDKVNVNP
jgi:uncharacterized protein YfaS (alpha-2-macroglobulin family)